MSQYRTRKDINFTHSSGILILLVGRTGTGKSSFINAFTGKEIMTVGHGLSSCTTNVESYTCYYLPESTVMAEDTRKAPQVVLVDTPGFDSSNMAVSDDNIWADIATWLTSNCNGQMAFGAILYFGDRDSSFSLMFQRFKNLKKVGAFVYRVTSGDKFEDQGISDFLFTDSQESARYIMERVYGAHPFSELLTAACVVSAFENPDPKTFRNWHSNLFRVFGKLFRPSSVGLTSKSLHTRGVEAWDRYQTHRRVSDLHNAIQRLTNALSNRPIGPLPNPDRSTTLMNLALALWAQCEHDGTRAENSYPVIKFCEEFIELSYPHPDPAIYTLLKQIFFALNKARQEAGEFQDAPPQYQNVFGHGSEVDAAQVQAQIDVASIRMLDNRHPALSEAIDRLRDVIDICRLQQSPTHQFLSTSLIRLARAFSARYNLTRELSDLREAIAYSKESLNFVTGSIRASTLINLSNVILTLARHEPREHVDILEKAITYGREARELTKYDVMLHAQACLTFADALLERNTQTSPIFVEQLDEAIRQYRELLEAGKSEKTFSAFAGPIRAWGGNGDRTTYEAWILPLSQSSDPPALYNKLGGVYLLRFQRVGLDPEDLQNAIKHYREVLLRRPEPGKDRVDALFNLSTAYIHENREASSTEAIAHLREAVKMCTPEDSLIGSHEYFSACLIQLSNAFNGRYTLRKEPSDLREAIEASQAALPFITGPSRASPLINLSNAIFNSVKHEPSVPVEEMEKVIEYSWEAIGLAQDDVMLQSQARLALADALIAHNTSSQGSRIIFDELDEAIDHYRTVLKVVGHEQPVILNSLAHAICVRCEANGEDLKQAITYERSISYNETALDLCEPEDRSRIAEDLASTHVMRFNLFSREDDLARAMRYCQEVVKWHGIDNEDATLYRRWIEECGAVLKDLQTANGLEKHRTTSLPLPRKRELVQTLLRGSTQNGGLNWPPLGPHYLKPAATSRENSSSIV